MSRDVVQIVSLLISLDMLRVILMKIRRLPSAWRWWVPFIIIALLTIVFYLLVLGEALGRLSSDVSSVLRLSTQLALWFYARYMPPNGGGAGAGA